MDKVYKEIIVEEKLYASILDPTLAKEGLDFLTENSSFLQVGTWNYKKGHKLEPHYHNEFSRESTITCEGIFVVKGKVKCNLYKKNKEKINSYEIQEGQIMFQFFGIHEYEIEEDSIVVEIKNGPYFGPDKDRTRVEI